MRPSATGTGPDPEANLTEHFPQRTYDPQHQAQAHPASPRAYDQPVGSPVPAVAVDAVLEQDAGIRSDSVQIEEGSEMSVDLDN